MLIFDYLLLCFIIIVFPACVVCVCEKIISFALCFLFVFSLCEEIISFAFCFLFVFCVCEKIISFAFLNDFFFLLFSFFLIVLLKLVYKGIINVAFLNVIVMIVLLQIVRCKACEFSKLNRPNHRFVRVTEPWEVSEPRHTHNVKSITLVYK